MGPSEKIEFIYKLLEEVKEGVRGIIGAPPFPGLEKIEGAADELSDWLSDHGEECTHYEERIPVIEYTPTFSECASDGVCDDWPAEGEPLD